MAQIDLKLAHIYVEDGFSAAGAVNNASGYSTGATTMIVDGIAGIIPNGTVFTVVGDTVEHVVTAHSETSSNTTSVTFTPGLGADVVDNAVITFSPHRLEIHIGTGNLTWQEKFPRQYIKDRGLLYKVRNGDQEPMDVSLDIVWEFLRSASGEDITPEEAIKGVGAASSWVTTSPDPCEPYAVNIVIMYDPNCSGVNSEKIVLPYFRVETLDHNLREGSMAAKGTSHATQATVTRVA